VVSRQPLDFDFLEQKKGSSIPIKGQIPAQRYHITLADVCAKHIGTVYSRQEAGSLLENYSDQFPGLDPAIIEEIFPQAIVQENRSFPRLPVILGDAPPLKLTFNLLYQDTRLKLAVEQKLGPDAQLARYQQAAKDLMEVVSVFLCTEGIHKQALWQDLTDNDLDALIYMILDNYHPERLEHLLTTGYRTNRLALAGLESILPHLDQLEIKDLIEYQVFAGTVWWDERGTSLAEQFAHKGQVVIDDIARFKDAVLGRKRHLVFLFDDNGELVWDLALILYLLRKSETLRVTGVTTTQIVANNANKRTLECCLQDFAFRQLQTSPRFEVFQEKNYRSAIDPSFCSQALLDLLETADLALIKGVSFFETIQRLPVDVYYAFVVHSTDSQTCTGLEKGDGVFARIPKGQMGFYYLEKTLSDIHPTL
jgi:hypothetical protein